MTAREFGWAAWTAASLMGTVACSEDDSPLELIGNAATGGSAAGAGGRGGGGSSGGGGISATGGSSGGGGTGTTDGGLPEFVATLDGDTIRLTMPSNVSILHCEGSLRMVQRAGGTWTPLRDDRPDASNRLHDAHYLDGALHDACQLSAGCDVSDCAAYLPGREPLEDSALVSREYVALGQAPAPTCDALDAGISLDAASDAGVRIIPNLESRVPAGPLGVEIEFFLDRQCRSEVITMVVPVE